MRLWHKNLISALPKAQLVAQWRECSAIAGVIIKNGTPNHLLVNKVLDYPIDHFITYSLMVRAEMTRRGYKTKQFVEDKIVAIYPNYTQIAYENLFKDWHNERYFEQCFYNLQEKYDCGGLTEEEWKNIEIAISGEF